MAGMLRSVGGWLYQQPYLLVSFTYLVWAINIVVGRYAAGYVPPVTLTFLRWGVAALMLLPFAWPYLKRDWPAIRANFPFMIFLGVSGTSGFAVLSYWGLHYTQALNGLLIQCTMPILVGCMSYILFRDRLSARQMTGIGISLLGVVVVLFRGDLDILHAIDFNRGDLLCIGSALVFASYSAMVKRRPAMHPLSFLAITITIGAVATLPLSLWEVIAVGAPALDIRTISIVLYIAIFPSILAYICYNRGVELIGPNRTVSLYPLIIVFGAAIAILFLGEQPQMFHLIGTLLIACGVVLAARPPRIRTPSEGPRL